MDIVLILLSADDMGELIYFLNDLFWTERMMLQENGNN